MSRENQIEEMAKVIVGANCTKEPCDECRWAGYASEAVDCTEYLIAEHLYNAGYRKSTEVAEEIFGEIERAFFNYYDSTVTYSSPTIPYHMREAVAFSLNEIFMKIAELKKKYTKSEDTNGT